MQVKTISSEMIVQILPWWVDRDLGEMPDDVLPPCGMVAYDESGPLAAGWMYEPMGCPLGIIDWIVSRPGLDPATARTACRAVLTVLEDIARECGYVRIFATCERAGMVREVEHCGFHVAAENMTHVIKNL